MAGANLISKSGEQTARIPDWICLRCGATNVDSTKGWPLCSDCKAALADRIRNGTSPTLVWKAAARLGLCWREPDSNTEQGWWFGSKMTGQWRFATRDQLGLSIMARQVPGTVVEQTIRCPKCQSPVKARAEYTQDKIFRFSYTCTCGTRETSAGKMP